MNPFQQLVMWLADQGVNPNVEETAFGWTLHAGSLRVDWDLDDDFTICIEGRPTMENLDLQEAQDEIEGWFV